MIQLEDGQIEAYFNAEEYMPLLPLLEQSLAEVKLAYPHRTDDNLIQLINCALDWVVPEYWQSLAVNWLIDDLPIGIKTREKLEKISQDKMFSQKLRHTILKLLKRP